MNTLSTSIAEHLTEVPAELSGLSLDDYRHLVSLLEAELTTRGLTPFSLDRDAVRVLTPDRRNGTWYLGSLARECANAERERWPAIMGQYIDRFGEPQSMLLSALERAKDFAWATERLRVRLFPSNHARMPVGGSVEREVAPGLCAVLVLDLGDALVQVGEELARGWAVARPALFELATRNVAEKVEVERAETEAGRGVALVTLYGESNAVSSHLLALDRHLPRDATRGALVVVPARHGVVFHVIRGVEMTDAIAPLRELAAMMYASEPGPISREVYWYRAGKLDLVRLKALGGRVVSLEGPHGLVTIAQRFSRR